MSKINALTPAIRLLQADLQDCLEEIRLYRERQALLEGSLAALLAHQELLDAPDSATSLPTCEVRLVSLPEPATTPPIRGPKGQTRLTEDDVREIRRRASQGESKETLAEVYGVTDANVRLILRRATWADV